MYKQIDPRNITKDHEQVFRVDSGGFGDRLFKAKTAILLIVALVCLLAACGNNESFDSAAWLKSDARARGRMSEDLVKRKILIGQTANEAQRVLGQPDRDYGSALSYKIDLGWPFKDSKHYGLLVHLDQNRNVREVQIVD